MQEIYEKMTRIFEDTLDIDNVELTPDTTRETLSEWDSLAHIRLVVAIEEAFDIRFSSEEVSELMSVKALVHSINERL